MKKPCETCGGSGQISFFKGVSRFLLSIEECPECAGLGFIFSPKAGTGNEYKKEKTMSDDLTRLAEEAIELELNFSELYLSFHKAFPEDADFWWRLVLEEQNHAALIKSAKEFFMSLKEFPADFLPSSLETLAATNQELLALRKKHRNAPPSRKEAFQMALTLEESAGEIHLQNAMAKPPDSRILEIFQKLNRDDKDHSSRIREYMEENGIC